MSMKKNCDHPTKVNIPPQINKKQDGWFLKIWQQVISSTRIFRVNIETSELIQTNFSSYMRILGVFQLFLPCVWCFLKIYTFHIAKDEEKTELGNQAYRKTKISKTCFPKNYCHYCYEMYVNVNKYCVNNHKYSHKPCIFITFQLLWQNTMIKAVYKRKCLI